jgi:uroporphyrinogen-III synthase
MIPLIVIRPQPGCDATLRAAREMGLGAYGFPLFTVSPLGWQAPDPSSFDALLIGSANALRHGGEALAAYRGKPVYVVGQTSADAAGASGFDVVACGEGGLQALLSRLLPGHCRLLRLAGREHVALIPSPGISIATCIVYASNLQPMGPELVSKLRQPTVVLLHSAEAARHFTLQCQDNAIACSQIQIAALGPRISAAAGTGWAALASAAQPHDNALLALAQQMCQKQGLFPKTTK